MALTIDAMTDVPVLRRRLARLGARMLAAGMLVAAVTAVALVVMHLPGEGGSNAAKGSPPGTHSAGPWGVSQPGYSEIDAPVATALRRLPVRLALPAAVGKPAGVYKGARGVRVRYGSGSHFGVFLLTVSSGRYGLRRPQDPGTRARMPFLQRQPAHPPHRQPARRHRGGRPAQHDHVARGRPHVRGARPRGHVLGAARHRSGACHRPRKRVD